MERKVSNPWAWQVDFGFVQGLEVSGVQRALYCAGQTPGDTEGVPAHAGVMRAQLGLALDDLVTVLQQAGFSLGDVVRLNVYTTDVASSLRPTASLSPGSPPRGAGPP